MFSKKKIKPMKELPQEEKPKNAKKKRNSLSVKINQFTSKLNNTSDKPSWKPKINTFKPSLAANSNTPSLAASSTLTNNSQQIGKPLFESTIIPNGKRGTNHSLGLALHQSQIISAKLSKTNKRNDRRDIKRLLNLSENVVELNNSKRNANLTWDELRSENTKFRLDNNDAAIGQIAKATSEGEIDRKPNSNPHFSKSHNQRAPPKSRKRLNFQPSMSKQAGAGINLHARARTQNRSTPYSINRPNPNFRGSNATSTFLDSIAPHGKIRTGGNDAGYCEEEEQTLALRDESGMDDTEIELLDGTIEMVVEKKGKSVKQIPQDVTIILLKDFYKTPETFNLKIAAAKHKNHRIKIIGQNDNTVFDSWARMMRNPKTDFRFSGDIYLNANMDTRSDWNFWIQNDFFHGFDFEGKERPLFPRDRGCTKWHGVPWNNMLQCNCQLGLILLAFSKAAIFDVQNGTLAYDVIALDRQDREFLWEFGDADLDRDVYITGIRVYSNLAFLYLLFFFPSLTSPWESLSLITKAERFNVSFGLTLDSSVRNAGNHTWQLMMHPKSLQVMIFDYLTTINSTLATMKHCITFESQRANKKIGAIPFSYLFDEKSELALRYKLSNKNVISFHKQVHAYNTSYKSTISRTGKNYPTNWRYDMLFSKARYIGPAETMETKLEAECQRLLLERDLTTGSNILFRTAEQQALKEKLDEEKLIDETAKGHKKAMNTLNNDHEYLEKFSNSVVKCIKHKADNPGNSNSAADEFWQRVQEYDAVKALTKKMSEENSNANSAQAASASLLTLVKTTNDVITEQETSKTSNGRPTEAREQPMDTDNSNEVAISVAKANKTNSTQQPISSSESKSNSESKPELDCDSLDDIGEASTTTKLNDQLTKTVLDKPNDPEPSMTAEEGAQVEDELDGPISDNMEFESGNDVSLELVGQGNRQPATQTIGSESTNSTDKSKNQNRSQHC
ncbi:unnamed protein product [Oikopleura dioica]|uniref:Uncharacterized protein n=1 Tax=Oikopleura dioica TaxID=34765 RepID=E4XLL5_OIKDI|nr:unnamed protein product [Oikopleura dioica]